MIRLIGTDLDGTFLRNDKSISAYSAEVVRRFHASGGFFVPVTGRPMDGLPPALYPLIGEGCIRYAITSNGARTYALDGLRQVAGTDTAPGVRARLLRKKEMTRACVRRVLDSVRSSLSAGERERTILEVFADGRGYHDPSVEERLMRRFAGTPVAEYLRLSRTLVEDLDAFIKAEDRSYENISVMLPDAEICGRVAVLLAEDPHTRVIRSMATDLEIISAEADKGIAFRELAGSLGIPASGTLALGDGDNDRGLLRAAGTSVVIRGADPALLAEADYLAGSNEEDGAALAIAELCGIT